MSYMFYDARLFTYDVSKWIGSAATSYQSNMFSGATAFKAKYWCPNVNQAHSTQCFCIYLARFLSTLLPPSSVLTPITNENIKDAVKTCLLQNSAKNYVDGDVL